MDSLADSCCTFAARTCGGRAAWCRLPPRDRIWGVGRDTNSRIRFAPSDHLRPVQRCGRSSISSGAEAPLRHALMHHAVSSFSIAPKDVLYEVTSSKV
jgi:hypothetical protein